MSVNESVKRLEWECVGGVLILEFFHERGRGGTGLRVWRPSRPTAGFNQGAMNTPGMQPRSASRGGRSQSLFYRDLSASPVTRAPSSRRELGTPGQAAAAAALWRENTGGFNPPPPPMFTLEDRVERSVDDTSGADQTYRNPDSAKYTDGRSSNRTPLSNGQVGYNYSYSDPIMEPSTLSASPRTPSQNQSASSPIWWSGSRDRNAHEGISGRGGDNDGVSPVSGVVQPQKQQPRGLLALEPPRDVVRPEVQRSGGAPDVVEGDEWVTVFGFGAEETNTVMRELEKCGPLVDYVSGPGGANWVHIQYQNRLDAKKALLKDGMMLNGSLIVGVKSLDPSQRQVLTDRRKQPASMTMARRTTGWGAANTSGQASQRPYYVQRTENGPRSAGVLATPAKSTVSKFVDFVFGWSHIAARHGRLSKHCYERLRDDW
ncbi:hypothetical protein KC19_VG171900 [Ceratodon purpureus]|uniref:RRM Nup35-type domain-containing protein n=1 Tax=Ceratodon purpureus TaxID=3225 RepID=A0A8T0HR13_CERPU|nr:hypothetical protein KC19_VG171900 [Ceratodon purpureus]